MFVSSLKGGLKSITKLDGEPWQELPPPLDPPLPPSRFLLRNALCTVLGLYDC